MSDPTPEMQVLRWIDDIVIGLNLCPFASGARKRPGALRLHLANEVTDMHAATSVVLGQARELLESPAQELRTTLVIFPHSLQSFEDLLEVTAQVEDALSQAGAEGILQVATFHPQYIFADAPKDDPANYTNRSPYPIIHLLREQDVSDAVDSHIDADAIPRQNIESLRALGMTRLLALWNSRTS
ncbi:MAG: DUF1415 domain-containing protein [Myxococcota bacterium]|nr:DUF1415 domain-containing protein [Myxococcota bacterium]